MAMSEDEILSEAGRIRARRRLRLAKTCARCGKNFEGIARAKYCSDACRMAAGREHAHAYQAPEPVDYVEAPRPGETEREFVIRKRAELVARGQLTPDEAKLTAEDERRINISDAMNRFRETTGKRNTINFDSTEIIRGEREKRSRGIASLHGWDE